MRILYGVVGEGMGHAIRSSVVLTHLIEQGHDVEVIASGRAVDFLRKHFPAVERIHGLHIVYENNRVERGKTLWSNVLSGVAAVPEQIQAYFDLITDFSPQCVISDFESWTYLFGKLHRLPVFSIDNMQIINRCVIPESIYEDHRTDFAIAKTFVKSKLPFCDHYLITTFFRPEIRKDNTTLVDTILRPNILAATPSMGEHLLVYQTAEGYSTLETVLRKTGLPCRVYGMRRQLTSDVEEGNLLFRPFSEETFAADLASARGVIAGGGFTLMGEAVYLKKPMLSAPVGAHFEQILNARYLEHMQLGQYAETLDSADAVESFLRNLPIYSANLEKLTHDKNQGLFAKLDELLGAL